MYIAFNLAHASRRPRRSQGAAIRILGCYPNIEALKSHVAQNHTGEIDVHMIPLRKWAAVLRSASPEKEIEHLERLGAAYTTMLSEHAQEFQQNVDDKKTGEVSTRPEEHHTAEDSTGAEPSPVGRSCELRGQRYAVISILPDLSCEHVHEQEPAFIVWATVDDETEAQKLIDGELCILARDVHIDVVSMYEWIPLTGLNLNSIKEIYRDESLADIMNAKKAESKNVEKYLQLCEQRGQQPSITDLDATAQSLSPLTSDIPVVESLP